MFFSGFIVVYERATQIWLVYEAFWTVTLITEPQIPWARHLTRIMFVHKLAATNPPRRREDPAGFEPSSDHDDFSSL
jgi:hypothetical protein